MKIIAASFFSLVAGAAMLAALTACSSTEVKEANLPAPQSQTAYTDYASDQVAYWRAQARHAPEADRRRYSTAVRDAQVTLDQLKRADGATWRSYRTRMEDSISNLEQIQRQAHRD